MNRRSNSPITVAGPRPICTAFPFTLACAKHHRNTDFQRTTNQMNLSPRGATRQSLRRLLMPGCSRTWLSCRSVAVTLTGMKPTVSIPNDIFELAERLARRARKSRSQLFSDALAEYLARHVPDEITAAMNRACHEGSRNERCVCYVRCKPHPEAKRLTKRSQVGSSLFESVMRLSTACLNRFQAQLN